MPPLVQHFQHGFVSSVQQTLQVTVFVIVNLFNFGLRQLIQSLRYLVLGVLSNIARRLSSLLLQHVVVHLATSQILPRCMDTALFVLLPTSLIFLLGLETSVDGLHRCVVTFDSLKRYDQLCLFNGQGIDVRPRVTRHVFSYMPPLRHPTRRSLLRSVLGHSLVPSLHRVPVAMLHNLLLNLDLRKSLLLSILSFDSSSIGAQLRAMVQLPGLGARMHRVRPSGTSPAVVLLVLHGVARSGTPFTRAVRVVTLGAEDHSPLRGPLPAGVTSVTSHGT
mmetsp:Transcript_40579/g.106606  ORF Transcript_40579/g.106606 Transcript_40579/m.106606 type:complete len:277 (-) Transcript_40579:17-847(-)